MIPDHAGSGDAEGTELQVRDCVVDEACAAADPVTPLRREWDTVLEWDSVQIAEWMGAEGLAEFSEYVADLNTGLELVALSSADIDLRFSARRGVLSLPPLTPGDDATRVHSALQRLRVETSHEARTIQPEDLPSSASQPLTSVQSPRVSQDAGKFGRVRRFRRLLSCIRPLSVLVGVVLLIAALQSNPVPWQHLGSVRLASEELESDFKGSIYAVENQKSLFIPVAENAFISVRAFVPPTGLSAEAEQVSDRTLNKSGTRVVIALQKQAYNPYSPSPWATVDEKNQLVIVPSETKSSGVEHMFDSEGYRAGGMFKIPSVCIPVSCRPAAFEG